MGIFLGEKNDMENIRVCQLSFKHASSSMMRWKRNLAMALTLNRKNEYYKIDTSVTWAARNLARVTDQPKLPSNLMRIKACVRSESFTVKFPLSAQATNLRSSTHRQLG